MAYITKDIDRLSGNLGIGAAEKQKLLLTAKHLNSFLKREEKIKIGVDFGEQDADDYEIDH